MAEYTIGGPNGPAPGRFTGGGLPAAAAEAARANEINKPVVDTAGNRPEPTRQQVDADGPPAEDPPEDAAEGQADDQDKSEDQPQDTPADDDLADAVLTDADHADWGHTVNQLGQALGEGQAAQMIDYLFSEQGVGPDGNIRDGGAARVFYAAVGGRDVGGQVIQAAQDYVARAVITVGREAGMKVAEIQRFANAIDRNPAVKREVYSRVVRGDLNALRARLPRSR